MLGKRARRVLLAALLVLNLMVLAGQVWPEGAPPFARVVDLGFLCSNLVLLGVLLARELRALSARAS